MAYLRLNVWKIRINREYVFQRYINMIPIQNLLDIIRIKLVNLLIYRFGAQVNQERPVPQNCSTPFYENRYQIMVILTERCHYFCCFSPAFGNIRNELTNFSVLHKAFTAFAYRIRAPPSEVWATNQISNIKEVCSMADKQAQKVSDQKLRFTDKDAILVDLASRI